MEKLTKEQIQDIDGFLKRHHVKFIDVRLELIDHLASEYETGNYTIKLHAFLMSKRYFIKDFMAKRQKSIHWSYQKKLWKQIAMFFYMPKYLILTLIIGFGLYVVKAFQNEIFILWSYIITTILPLGILLYKQFRSSKFKNLQSFQPMVALTALPSLFLYSFPQVEIYLPITGYGFYAYWFLALLFGVSAVLVFNRLVIKIEDDYTKLIAS